ncbi:Prenylated rab acceptor 1 [Phaffia rhodozyma]|uniref:PRA1 family protein n=1 Tax=Phaffia rhodozyma TaxID=264483 RepID=A0A0F7SFF6_PHARH|nr:Prenylated rab acceptor 1 [Phaffia rhodozyma]
MDIVIRAPEYLKSFRETKLSALRPLNEFFDHQKLSRPVDMNEATSRISYNTRYFSGNYGVVIATLAIYALITNPLLLLSLGFLVGGFIGINKWAPEPFEIAGKTIDQKSLYITLFIIGLPVLWWSAPLSTFFWLVGASMFIIFSHAALLEPGVESEYASADGQV